ncbi:hypothetical protein LSAT2_025890, partial [Lamellibrachia satsuma]
VGMARCTLCVCDFSVTSGGRTDVRRHVKTTRHQKMSKTMVAAKGGNDVIDGVTKAETMVISTEMNVSLCRLAAKLLSHLVAEDQHDQLRLEFNACQLDNDQSLQEY